MGATRLLAATLVAALFVPRAVHAQRSAALAEDTEIRIDAEEISYDQRANTVVARGHVVIHRGETELRADEVQLNRATNEAAARGHVSVSDPEGTIFAEHMQLNMDEETGSLEAAQIYSPRYQYSLWGDRVEKGLGQSYSIVNGRFTTCHCAEGAPSWSISGKELQVALSGYGTLKGGTFNILDTPVLYVPRAVFPVQRDRQSGFLLPRFGASNLRGFQTVLPFYWAIDKSQDATVALDVETSARAGLVGEYRYALSRDAHGFVDASYFNESFRGSADGKPFEMTVPRDRWSVAAEHTQPFIGTSHAYADVFLVGDDLFLRDVNTYAFEHAHDVTIRTLPFTQSRVGAVQLWDRVGLKAEAIYYRDLTGSQSESQTLQRLPEVDLWGQTLLGNHLLGDVNASVVDFQRSQRTDGMRVDLEPGVTLPLPLGRYAFGAIRASGRETAYHLTDDDVTEGIGERELATNQHRELLHVDAEVGTTFSRVYPMHSFGLEKLKHTLEPEITYLYVPAVAQGDRPFFDGTDRINQRDLLTYGLVSRVLGKFAENAPAETPGGGTHSQTTDNGSIRELARFSLMQSYDIGRTIGSAQAERGTDHFSDVDLDGRINPSRALSVRFRTDYDAGTNTITAARVGFFVEDPRGLRPDHGTQRLETRTSAGVSYRFLTQNLVQALQEVDSNIVLRVTDWAGFLYSNRYDVTANRFLDNFFGLRLISTCDCWALDLALTDRTNPHEVEFRAQLTLAGFGSSKSQSRVAAVP